MATVRNLRLSDGDSGEMLPFNQPRPYSFRSRAHMVIGREVESLADYDLSALELKIFLSRMFTLSDGAYHQLDIQQLARDMGRDRKNLSVAVKRLVDIGLFIREPGNARPGRYMVNPAVAFRGTSDSHRAAVRDYGRELRQTSRNRKIAAVPAATEATEEADR